MKKILSKKINGKLTFKEHNHIVSLNGLYSMHLLIAQTIVLSSMLIVFTCVHIDKKELSN